MEDTPMHLLSRAAAYAATAVTALALVTATATTGFADMPAPAHASAAASAPVSASAAKPAASANPTSGYWTGTWATAPQSGGDTFDGQTIRQVVHTSISGTEARLQLSNAFGTAALNISDVQIAEAGSGSSIVAGTDHPVTFGGSSSVSIPAGGTGISDTIAFAIPALTSIAISFYLPDNTGASTFHQYSMATTYIASGDVSAAASLTNPETENNYYFLSSLDVQNPNSEGSVVAFGASITDGYNSTVDADDRWTDTLASRLNAAGDTVGVLDEGIAGNRLLVDGSGQSAINRFDRDVLGQPGVRWVVFSDDPINDLGTTTPQPTAAQLIAGIQQLITMAHQNGISFICSTLTPYQGSYYWNQSGETAREAVNAWIRTPGNCDGVIDQDNATHNPADPTEYLPAYDSGDHLHPSDAGYQAIGDAANLALFTQPDLPVISLRAHADDDIVTADDGGGDPLIANRTVIGFWETFQLIDNPDGSISLRADANGDYVAAATSDPQPLIADATSIGANEEFDLIYDN
jgi:lysophospholipase L1-like esterase